MNDSAIHEHGVGSSGSPWGRRKASVPALAGGHEGCLTGLRTALQALSTPVQRDSIIPWPPEGSQVTAVEAANQLAPAGLVTRNADGTIEATAAARLWLETQDNVELIKIFHTNLRFIGELMQEIRGNGASLREILEISNQKYKLGWQSLDPVHRRCYWLRATGLAELSFTGKMLLTDMGLTALQQVTPVSPARFTITEVDIPISAIPQLSPLIAQLVAGLTDADLSSRVSAGLSYVPRGRAHSFISSLAAQVDIATPSITKSDYVQFCAREFSTKDSSAISALDALRNTTLVRQTGRETFAATDAALAWRESGLALDLVCIVHANIRCVGELLPMLEEPRSFGELASMATSAYTGLSAAVGALRNRLQLLREADLVDQPTTLTYRATPLGIAFAKTIPLEAVKAEAESIEPEPDGQPDRLVREFLEASTDTTRPDRFEQATTEMFRALGLAAEHLGGSGRTDILISVRTTPTDSVRIIVDTKATKHSSVQEGAVDFSTLEEHRHKHSAEHVALVATGFDDGRVKARAKSSRVSLITVSELIGIFEQTRRRPLAPVDLLKLFIPETKLKIWIEPERQAKILAAIISAIAEESEYLMESGGSFFPRDIHRGLRRVLDPLPDISEVTQVLTLLSSPFVDGVRTDGKGGYRPGVPAESIAARLRFLAVAADQAAAHASE